MTESILNSTKASLGIPEEQTAFDVELLMHINSAFTTLTQLGVGPSSGLTVEDDVPVWSDLIGNDPRLNSAKSYVYLRVKLLFDPPEVGFVLTAMKQQIEEQEWRLNVTVDDELPIEEEVLP